MCRTIVSLGLLLTVSLTAASELSQISIHPASVRQYRTKGDNYLLQCVLNVSDANLIANFEWLDPKNNTIDVPYMKLNPRFSVANGKNLTRILTIEKFQEQDGGAYTCVANYSTNTLTKYVEILPIQSIKFVDAPSKQIAINGTKYKIKCKVEANPPPTVKWVYKSQYVINGSRYIIESDGLVIDSVQESDEGQYTCVVNVNITEESEYERIQLEVITRPTIISRTKILKVVEGRSLSTYCEATGKPEPAISWITIPKNKDVDYAHNGYLQIFNISREYHAFVCDARNVAGAVQHIFYLSVQSEPKILDSMNDTVKVGNMGSISCRAFGIPPPSVTIRKYNYPDLTYGKTFTQIPDYTENHTVIATLNFYSVGRFFDGLYECVATNEVGRDMRKLRLTVQFKPTFNKTEHLTEVITWENIPANLTCVTEAEAIPEATFSWYFNDKLIEKEDEFYTFLEGTSSTSLWIRPLDKRVYGRYRCVAKNNVGDDFQDFTLKEVFPPQSISEFEFKATTATTISFQIMDPVHNGGLPIKGYIVQYKPATELKTCNETKTHAWTYGSSYSYVLFNLEPSVKYHFQFAAYNDVGISAWSPIQERQMPDISVPGVPIILNFQFPEEKYINSSYSTVINLDWSIPPSNGPAIDTYKLKYCVAFEDEKKLFELRSTCKFIELADPFLESFKIQDLNPDTLYKVELLAHNNIGYSEPSVKFFRTKIADESPAHNIIVTEDSDSHFLTSLLPFLKGVSPHRKLEVRHKLQQVIALEG